MKPVVQIAVLTLSAIVLALVIRVFAQDLGNRDFVAYWASGQELARQSNPYDGAAIYRVEQAAGFSKPEVMIMRNPPHALLLALPLGYLTLENAAVLWWLAFAGIFILCLVLLRRHWNDHGFAYAFLPALLTIAIGKITMFALLGLVLFLVLRRHSFWAGTALALASIEAHLFLPLGLVLLSWIVSRREWKILAGGAAGFATLLMPALTFDSSVMGHYLEMLRGEGITDQFVPTFGALVRILVNRQAVWLQSFPLAIAAIWAVRYFRRHRAEWDWHTHGMLLLAVSVFVAPYAWPTDEIVLLPVVVCGLSVGSHLARGAFLTLNVAMACMFAIHPEPVSAGLMIWTGGAWLVWYIAASRVKTLPGVSVGA